MFRKRCYRREFARRATSTFFVLAFLVGSSALFAQTKTKPYPASPGLAPVNRPSLPTGELASFARLQGVKGVMQPVEWILPKGVGVEVALEGSFASDANNKGLFAVEVGRVYRFKITGVPGREKEALYPTLELIGRLNPPKGKEWDFPIEIEVPSIDLENALNGSFVTRVIFVENSENPADVDSDANRENLTFDVPGGVDPVVAASTRGRPLAILRLGTRAPNGAPTAEDPFFFGLPRVDFRPVVLEDEALEEVGESKESDDSDWGVFVSGDEE